MAYPSVSLVTHFLYACWHDPASQYSYFVRDNVDFSAYELGKIDRSTDTVITTNTAAYSAFPNIITFMGGLSDPTNLILGEYSGSGPFANTIHYLNRSTLAVSSTVALGASESTNLAVGPDYNTITSDGRYWAATSFDATAIKSWIRIYDKTTAKYGLIDFTTLSADRQVLGINFDSVPNLWVGTSNSSGVGHLYRCTITEGASSITLSIANTYSPFSGNNGAFYLTYRPTANQFILWASDYLGTNPTGFIINQSNGATSSTFTWPASNPPNGGGVLTLDKAGWTNQRYFIEVPLADGSYHTPYKLLDMNNSASETDYATSLWGFQIATRNPFWNGNVAGQANAIFDPVFSTSADVFDQQFVLLQFPAASNVKSYVDVFSNRT